MYVKWLGSISVAENFLFLTYHSKSVDGPDRVCIVCAAGRWFPTFSSGAPLMSFLHFVYRFTTKFSVSVKYCEF